MNHCRGYYTGPRRPSSYLAVLVHWVGQLRLPSSRPCGRPVSFLLVSGRLKAASFLTSTFLHFRRPIFLIASVMLVGSSVWAAKSGNSYESHLGARLLQGFSAGATESLLPLIITDMTFIHQRSKYFGAYWVVSSLPSQSTDPAGAYQGAVGLGRLKVCSLLA
jgi:MFS family permease